LALVTLVVKSVIEWKSKQQLAAQAAREWGGGDA
jgi:hypothetical protein